MRRREVRGLRRRGEEVCQFVEIDGADAVMSDDLLDA
jgi:hypothetical protein